jgi:hypothetical protein
MYEIVGIKRECIILFTKKIVSLLTKRYGSQKTVDKMVIIIGWSYKIKYLVC